MTWINLQVVKLKSVGSTFGLLVIKEVKGLIGGCQNNEGYLQMLDESIPSPKSLADWFNNFLLGLTSHFMPLQSNAVNALEVPREVLINSFSKRRYCP